MPVERLRWIAFSHVEADECGGLQECWRWPRTHAPCAATSGRCSSGPTCPTARPAASRRRGDRHRRAAAALDVHAAHPHGWDCGYLHDLTTRTLLCGDLFTQGGHELPALTTRDILGAQRGVPTQMD
jgi:hypothetical protein